MVLNKQVIFSKIPNAQIVVGEHLTSRTNEFDLDQLLVDGEFITKTLELSLDPYMRGRMTDPSVSNFIHPFTINEPISSHGMIQVVRSKNPDFKEGDLIYGMVFHEEYSKYNTVLAKALGFVIRNEPKVTGLPISNYVGAFGLAGLTAYGGLFKIADLKKGDTIYVSSASGAVGQLVGQIAKMEGLYVVGSAGTDEKVKYLKEIGFDGAFNYKTADIKSKLLELCPKGIDIYFENVGGEALEIILDIINNHSCIMVCGMISQYGNPNPYPIKNLINVIIKRIKIQGFSASDFYHFESEFIDYITKGILSGKINYKEDVAMGIEKVPQTLLNVLTGKNFGKAVVHVSNI